MKKNGNRSRITLRIFTAVLSAAVLFGGTVVTFSDDYKGDIADTKEQISDAKDKLSDIQKKINERQETLSQIASELKALESERLENMSDREVAIEELKLLKTEIENFDDELAAMEDRHKELEDLLLDRSRVMYQASTDFELLQLFFHSDGIFDFLRKLDIYKTMLEEDRDLIESVKESERQLEEKKAQREIILANKATVIAQLELAIEELERDEEFVSGNYAALTAMLENLEADEVSYTKEIDDLTNELNRLEKLQREAEEAARRAEEERKRKEEEARKAAEAEKKRLEEEARKAAEAAAKAKAEAEAAAKAKAEAEKAAQEALKPKKNPKEWNFCWPIEHYSMFSGKFGYRTHPITKAWQLHAGVDLVAGTGTKIYAAQSGTVSMAGNNGPYGLCVIIDHGEGLQSVYGHCSKLLVSVGQTVTRGQTIALVGMTGGATGPHLHFEVRENGTPVDPLPYVEGLY